MSYLQAFQVYPRLPEPVKYIETLVRNMWWSWNLDCIELFRRIDPKLWNRCHRNPILFFTSVSPKRMENLAVDESFLAHLKRVRQAFEKQVESPPDTNGIKYPEKGQVAYFSMEFGVHESIPIYAGGLGMLAGDHLKAASDLNEPLVAIGLLFQMGYFQQYLDQNGWQQESYSAVDLYQLPIVRVKNRTGEDLIISIDGPEGPFHAQVFKIMVGRIPLYLMDTNIRTNRIEDRGITARLYAADGKIRLQQELLLGIGGMRILKSEGIHPAVCHLNEGHCAFAGLERLVQIMEKDGVDLKTAMEIVPRSTVFTTHTPVPAGHDEFPPAMVKPYLTYLERPFGMRVDDIVKMGQPTGAGTEAPFCMFVLGIRLAQFCNGVSRLHGRVARRMWAHVWPGRPEEEVPIGHITNGIHIPSWISIENSMLFDRYLGPDWLTHSWNNAESINRIDEIYDEELWRAREMSRSRLIRSCRDLMVQQYGRRNAPRTIMESMESVLDPDVLTIGFARRFATYKRATLLLSDPGRLEAILSSTNKPVQMIFAGKAHPRDNEGKAMIQRIIEFAMRPGIRHKVIFLENYDPHIARLLIQGCDVWLNNPRRPFEACGTSGIKAATNGVLNLSILDGWWDEGFTEERGWRIGNGEEYDDYGYQDAVESQALYNVLENDVIPCFYERKGGGVPERWVHMMKASMKMAMGEFSARLMISRYVENYYIPAARRFHELLENQAAEARRLRALHERLRLMWNSIRVDRPVRSLAGPFRLGDRIVVSAEVFLGDLKPDEVLVELCYGKMKSVDALETIHPEEMTVKEDRGGGRYLYECALSCRLSGRFGMTARVTPRADNMLRTLPGLIVWA